MGGWAITVVLIRRMASEALGEVNPSTEGAVGSEMNWQRVRWLTMRVISVSVPEPTAR